MLNQVPFELISNFLSIILLLFLGYRFLQYKKKLEIIKEIDKLKDENKLTEEDKKFIKTNEREYKEKIIASENNARLANPLFIFLIAALVFAFSFQEALIHMNIIVVSFIFIQVDKLHKRTLYKFLFELKKEIKEEE